MPAVAILATAKRLEPPDPAAEGFAEAFRVSAREDGGFEVAPW